MTLNILVCNDDGIQAVGIQTLAAHLALHYNVYVVAPDRERSATGHALTLHHPLRVEEVTMGQNIKAAYAVSGTPTDCIKLSLNALLSFKPDIIVSGINHGPNLGADVLYSGTVSAALEGALNHVPSIAVSLLNGYLKDADFGPGADFIARFIPTVIENILPPQTILNINIPGVPITEMMGIQMTRLGVRLYTDTYEKRLDPRNKVYYWLAGEVITNSEEIEDSDVSAMRNDKISITPVTFNMTNLTMLETHKAIFERPIPPLANQSV